MHHKACNYYFSYCMNYSYFTIEKIFLSWRMAHFWLNQKMVYQNLHRKTRRVYRNNYVLNLLQPTNGDKQTRLIELISQKILMPSTKCRQKQSNSTELAFSFRKKKPSRKMESVSHRKSLIITVCESITKLIELTFGFRELLAPLF